ncbi:MULTISPECIES: hypothetical protein [unclassified Bradyrhizobium]|uniref:hypothetical protein n=1 Tax=unclassified Bradyrhizobium TaxID=2631580 RepID=UPI0028E73C6E|nr:MULTISPECIES: hypothetical protein [unclassified Bradyrhizobium]
MARLQQEKQAAVTTGSAEHPAFPARWAYDLYVISLGIGVLAPIARARRQATLPDLTSATRGQDHTTSSSAIDQSSRNSA